MKLADAILMNGLSKPQGFGPNSVASIDAPCAIGGALQSIGRQFIYDTIPNYTTIRDTWHFVEDDATCPVCKGVVTGSGDVLGVIWHLNDIHHWTRAQIAEWVATVEPQESVTSSADTNRQASDATASTMGVPIGQSDPSADSYSVSEHAFEHSCVVMGTDNVQG